MAAFEPRPSDQVASLRRQMELELAAKEDQQAFAAATAAAMSSKLRTPHTISSKTWGEGPHARRILALMEVATRSDSGMSSLSATVISLATESLTVSGIK